MISDATLLDFDQRYGLRTYFKKRFNKIVLPYLFWSFVGILFQHGYLHTIKSDVWGNFIKGFLTEQCISIYWFFIPLFCLYLSIPLFASVPEEKRKRLFLFLAVASFIFNNLISFIKNIFRLTFPWMFTVNAGSGYLLYLIIGYLFTRCHIAKGFRYLLYLLGIIGLMAHILGTYYLSVAAGSIVKTYTGYLNVPCILYSSVIFVFFRYQGSQFMQNIKVKSLVDTLVPYTFNIYYRCRFVKHIGQDGF